VTKLVGQIIFLKLYSTQWAQDKAIQLKGCCAAVWWAGYHADRNGLLHQAYESFPGCLMALFTNHSWMIMFDGIPGGSTTTCSIYSRSKNCPNVLPFWKE